MAPVVTAAEMRELDRRAIEDLGLPGAVLMESAGRHVADEVLAETAPGDKVLVVCGAGNNGGDGFVAARWLREHGRDARVVLVLGRPRPGGDAALYLGLLEKLGAPILDAGGEPGLARLDAELPGARVIVDAIFGTGLAREVDPVVAQVIARLNRAPARRVAVDIPSGLDADTGRVLGACVEAHTTVTFAFAKIGLVSAPGFEHAGQVRVVDIGIPRASARELGVRLELIEEHDARAWLPARPRSGHKGTFGHLLVVAGSVGKTGAALLCASAGLRAGAGLVTLAVPPAVRGELEGRVPEVMLAELDLERPPAEVAQAFAQLAQGKRAVAVGPGMPTSDTAGAALAALLGAAPAPVVLDADALNHLARTPGALDAARVPLALTPHPGEAARLLGVDTQVVQLDRVGTARALAARAGCVVALKGARTVVADPDGRATLNPTGNPGMGTGGSGDVLTGVIGALAAQGVDLGRAVRLGVYVHGRAGDLAAAATGQRGLIAGDLVARLPAALASLG